MTLLEVIATQTTAMPTPKQLILRRTKYMLEKYLFSTSFSNLYCCMLCLSVLNSNFSAWYITNRYFKVTDQLFIRGKINFKWQSLKTLRNWVEGTNSETILHKMKDNRKLTLARKSTEVTINRWQTHLKILGQLMMVRLYMHSTSHSPFIVTACFFYYWLKCQ